MKRFFLLLLGLVPCLVWAQGVKVGPWISDAGDNHVTVLWTSEVPGTAYVQLEDGRTV